MKKSILLSTVSLLLIACGTIEESNENGSDATFYVSYLGNNENDGSLEKPWKTIQFAIDSIDEKATLVIKSGVYNERVLFLGDEDSNIYLKAEKGTVIDGRGLKPIHRQALVGIHNAHDIVIENLELRNFKTSVGEELSATPVGILIDGTSHDINITRNTIHHIENLSTCSESDGCATGANGIAVYGDTTTTMTNLNFIGNEVYNCILSSSEAFSINGNIDGFRVVDNYIHDNNNIGIDIIGYEKDVCSTCIAEKNRARNGIVRNNRAINNSTNLALGSFNSNPWYKGSDGSAGGFYVDGGHHILFEGNRASQNDLGFEFASEHSGGSSDNILMVGNYIYNNRETGLALGGYNQNSTKEGGGGAKNIMVYNNSFYMNAGWGSEIIFSYRVEDTTIANNIIYGEGKVSENFSTEQNNQSKNIIWGRNIWWGEDPANVSGVKGDAFLVDPHYIDGKNGNLNLQSDSPAIDAGVEIRAITSWSNDFWKREFEDGLIPTYGTRDIQKQIDIGADEV